MEPIVETTAGRVRGRTNDRGVHAFLGVPYGGDTAGRRRFLPPGAPSPWPNVRDALKLGPVAAQLLMRPGASGITSDCSSMRGDEDCLVLNIWTAGLDEARRPVMVWLHGGGFANGVGTSPGGPTNGENIARTQDVVSVTLNHRLGVLGYLKLDEALGDEYAESGLAGQLDIVMALAWVRDNIARFGGDPGNVTVYGESGGGMKVSTLLAMPAAKGLFHKAIVQSGPGVRLVAAEDSEKLTEGLLAELGLTRATAADLLKLPTEKILLAAAAAGGMRAGANALGAGGNRAGFGPVVGSAGLPEHPFDPVASPLSAHVPLLVGTTMHEAAYVLGQAEVSGEMASAYIARAGGAHADEMSAAYKAALPGASAKNLLLAAMTDIARYGSGIMLERRIAAGAAPSWAYVFAVKNKYGYAAHGLELAFHFETLDRTRPEVSSGGLDLDSLGLDAPDTESNRRVSAAMSASWAAFARTGKPSTDQLTWPEYTIEGRECLHFDDPVHVAADMPSGVRDVWDKLNFYG